MPLNVRSFIAHWKPTGKLNLGVWRGIWWGALRSPAIYNCTTGSRVITMPPAKCRTPELPTMTPVADDKPQMWKLHSRWDYYPSWPELCLILLSLHEAFTASLFEHFCLFKVCYRTKRASLPFIHPLNQEAAFQWGPHGTMSSYQDSIFSFWVILFLLRHESI